MQAQLTLSSSPIHQVLQVTRIYKSWTEVSYDELTDGPKLTRATVSNILEGDIEGESWEEYLMMYQYDGSCSFVSMERVVGCIGDRSGSFVVKGVGTYEQGIAQGQLTIVPGSGTRDFTDLKGFGEFFAVKGQHATVILTCTF